jgi:hypothetical protein
MNKKTLLKTAGNGFIILVVGLLTYKFIMWNYWKVERAAALAKGILNAPPAINLTLSKENIPLFQTGFAYNPAGYYLINQFDLSPYIVENSKLTLQVGIDDQKVESPVLYTFKTFNMIKCRENYFVFTTRDCGIEDFVKLRDSIPSILHALAVKEQNGNRSQ